MLYITSPWLIYFITRRLYLLNHFSYYTFPTLLPSGNCPLQAVFTQPTPVLSLGSDLGSQSLSSQPPPVLADEQTSLSGW